MHQKVVEMSSRHQVAVWRSVVYHDLLQALHTVFAQSVYRPSDFLLTTIINIIYAHACLCVAWYMRALFMLAACVEHNANGSIDCCCHTIPATVPPTYMSLPWP